jgi:L-ribulose-5-phosphate 4-epimerase
MPDELSHPELRTAVTGAVATLFAHGVMSRTGHGDLSARAPDDQLILTEPGRLRGLTPGQLAVVSLDGTVREGHIDALKAEIAELHARIYRLRPDIGCIIHTHSAHVLAFALAGRPLPCNYEAMRFSQPSPVPVVPWERRGTPAWIETILACLEEHPGTNAVLQGNHGVLVFGPGTAEAVTTATVLEEAAEAEIHADPLGGARPLVLDPGGAAASASGTASASPVASAPGAADGAVDP